MLVYVKRTNIYLRDDHLKKLKTISVQTGAPMSALIRKAIEEYLKKAK
jgi:predicted DNA-binding protein